MKRRDFLKLAGAGAVGLAGMPSLGRPDAGPKRKLQQTMAGYAAPPMEVVRAGFIGVGARGSGHVSQMLALEGVQVKAIADPHIPSAQASAKACVEAGQPAPDLYTDGDLDYRRMLERDDIDIVLIATPWEWHVRMAVDTMRSGKHAFTEVPASYTIDGCWELVETAEETRRHCMMMENVNYGREELMVLNMARLGVFGELIHGEAAYIHDLRGQMHQVDHGTGSWRTLHYTRRNGNLYPTHGLGPVAQYMNINRGDRLDYLSSVGSKARVRELYADENFPEEHPRTKQEFICGDISTSICRTVNGKTIMIQWDEQSPRPYTRLNFLQGTRGAWGGFPNRCVIEGISESTHEWEKGEELANFYERFDHPLWRKQGDLAVSMGGHGGMDFLMLWRIVYCLRNGEPLDQDVYDAATWSVITPLSEWSVANRGASIDVPDFTRNQWRVMKPLEIIDPPVGAGL